MDDQMKCTFYLLVIYPWKVFGRSPSKREITRKVYMVHEIMIDFMSKEKNRRLFVS
jgi:hypothetical protein